MSAFLVAALSLSPCHRAWAKRAKAAPCRRVVILSPAAADVFNSLGAGQVVVGVTKSVALFPRARRVGSHIRPNVEIISSLKPDLLVVSSNRFFSEEMAQKVGCQVFHYNPVTCNGILKNILDIGRLLGREHQAEALVERLKGELASLRPISNHPTVLYEVMEHPYMVAGSRNIVADMVRLAGGLYLVSAKRKIVRLSYEKALSLSPQVYIYQVGPMNKNPLPPGERPFFKGMNARFVRVDELKFARPNTNTFDEILWLNRLFVKMDRQ